jgi:DNA invertase Pin-like site-specific DNA recombinase
MDRLARSLTDLLQIVEQLTSRGIHVQFVKEAKVFRGGDSTDPMDMLMLSMLGAVAEYERTLIRERQKEGIAKARQRGVYKGSRPKITDTQLITQIATEFHVLGANKTRLAAKYGISRDTLYKYVKSVN